MSSRDPQSLYDEYYYATGCGLPYRRDEHWTTFFARIADEIVAGIAPGSVMDAGCALGLLVEQLRERGVEAEGVDISEFAIANAPEVVRPFVRVGSVAEPFGRRYDLIVCIEVLEHMPREEAERAIANFCAHSDDVLFSSSPMDYKESSHFNVHPIEHWAELFARQGFVRDVEFDASFLTPWATRFRRSAEPTPRLLRDYERRFYQLWKETTDLRALSVEQREHMRGLEQHVRNLELLNSQLRDALAVAMRDSTLTRAMARLDREAAADSLNSSKEQEQRYLARLQQELAEKAAHIAALEDLVRRIEAGRVMKLLKQVNERANQLRAAPPLRLPERLPIPGRRPAPPPAQPAPPPPQPAPPAAPSPEAAYPAWIAAVEPGAAALQAQRAAAPQLPARPLISLITPVFNPPVAALEAMLASVRAQTYDRWELCLADASTAEEVRAALARAAAGDGRIKLRTLGENRGISGNSNAALDMAAGDFVLILDHDDALAPDALFEVVRALGERPDADIVYYDEDKITEDGAQRHSPWFKPSGHSPDLLLSTNYLMHGVFRRSLVAQVGGFDPAADGAQDWDLALRLTERTSKIVHIPRVLYHWRQVPGSASRDANAKPWALAGQEHALRGHLERTGPHGAQVVRLSPSDLRVAWPTSGRLVSIIIPSRDKVDLLRACLSSIFAQTSYPSYEVLIVDNGSEEPRTLAYYEELRADERVRVIPFAEPFNWSRANNRGAAEARGDLLLFLNNDTEARDAGWLTELAGWTERPEVGVVGCRLVRPDGTTQHAGIAIGVEGHGSHIFDGDVTPIYGPFGSSEWYRDLMAVTGACLMTRRDVFEALGGFDERYMVGYSDITYCVDAHARGLRVIYTPHTTLLHHEGASRGYNLPAADVLRGTVELLPAIDAGDPYYSPNLSPVQRRPAVADPAGETRQERIALILNEFRLAEHATAERVAAVAARLRAPRPHRPAVAGVPRRVLLCSHELSLSGAPLMLFQLGRQLRARGYDVTLAAPARGPLAPAVEASEVALLVNRHLYADALEAAAVVRDFELVLVNTVLGWRVIHAAHGADVPSVWWVHESRFGRDLMLREPGAREALDLAGGLVFPAEATARLYADLTRRALPAPLPYGVNPPAVPEGGVPRRPDRVQVAIMASLEPRKGQDVAVDALKLLPAALREQMDLYLVGGVLDQAFYRHLRHELAELPNVAFTGLLTHPEALQYLALADIFLLPSRDEVLPVALLEAMALGKAIIISDVGGVAEAVRHGQEAMVVPPGDARALADDLAALVANPELRARLGTAARARYAERFTAEGFADAMEAVVRGLLPTAAGEA
jgi:GT2 family glycosyltransferase/glycosyltransferase involved in cell wall biosynthesis